MEQNETIARIMYDNYCQGVGGYSFNGNPLPPSEIFFTHSTTSKQADAWRMAADAALAAIVKLEAEREDGNSDFKHFAKIAYTDHGPVLIQKFYDHTSSHPYKVEVKATFQDDDEISNSQGYKDKENRDLTYDHPEAAIEYLIKQIPIAKGKFKN